MKKNYIKPEMDIVKIEITQMIATSVGISSADPIDAVDASGREGNYDFE